MEITQSFLETFFQFSTNWDNSDVKSEVKTVQSLHGHMALCELAKEWTTEFEDRYKDQDWEDLDWYDTLEEFFESKNI